MWDNQKKERTIVGEYKTIAEIVTEVMKDKPFYEESGGGITLSGGEVLYQAAFAIELLKELKNRKIHTACETTGYAGSEVFEEFISFVDLLYFDIKHYDSAKHKSSIGVPNEQIIKNLQTAVRTHSGLVVRIPVIPFFNDSLSDAEEFAKLFNEIGVDQIELLPFHQFGEKKYEYLNREYTMHDIPQLHTEDLEPYKAVMDAAGIECLAR